MNLVCCVCILVSQKSQPATSALALIRFKLDDVLSPQLQIILHSLARKNSWYDHIKRLIKPLSNLKIISTFFQKYSCSKNYCSSSILCIKTHFHTSKTRTDLFNGFHMFPTFWNLIYTIRLNMVQIKLINQIGNRRFIKIDVTG